LRRCPPFPLVGEGGTIQLLRQVKNRTSERLYQHFFCFGRKRFVSMVRPTVTKDVPGCNNRFAPLGENYASYQIRRTLEVASGKDPTPPTQGRAPPLSWPNQLTPTLQLQVDISHELHTPSSCTVKLNTYVKEATLSKGKAVRRKVARQKVHGLKLTSVLISR